MPENALPRQENKMGTEKVRKLLISMSIPMMASMLIQALYNVVDSIFVTQISENAFTGLALAFPIQSILIGLAVGTGVGFGTLLSRSLGAKDFKAADKSASNGLFLYAVSYIIVLVVGLLIMRPFFAVQTEIEEIVDSGTTYMTICLAGSIFMFGEIGFNRLLQSTGRTTLSMFTQLTGAVVNIILDPVFIFGLNMGVAGAALATVIGQICGTVVGLILNLKLNHDIKLSFKGFRPDGAIIKKIYTVGLPSIMMQSISSVMLFLLNAILISFTETAVSFFGVYFKLQSFIFMPVFGLNNGMVPIVAYNYGARKKRRIYKTINLAIIYALVIMAVGMLFMEFFPELLLGMFNPSERMLEIGVPGLRIIAAHFMLAGLSICIISAIQALGNGIYALIVSFARQLIVLLPAAWLLSLSGNLDLVWLAFPIAEVCAALLALCFFLSLRNKKITPLPDGE